MKVDYRSPLVISKTDTVRWIWLAAFAWAYNIYPSSNTKGWSNNSTVLFAVILFWLNKTKVAEALVSVYFTSTKVAFAESMRPSADFTIEYWMKTVNNQTAGHMFYVGEDSAAGRAFSDITSNKLRFGVRMSSGGSNDPPDDEVMMEAVHNTANAYNDDNWHHIVHVCDVENTKLKIYADGKKIFQDAFTDMDAHYISSCVPFLSTTEPLYIGYRSGTNGFTGLIDEFKWYTRKLTDGLTGSDHTTDGNALTVTVGGEISKNYKHGKGKHKN